METDLLTVQQNEEMIAGDRNPSPFSKEELKDFYLKFARVANPTLFSPNRSDFEILNFLRKDLKKHLATLSKHTQHARDEGIPEIQTACGFYSVQDSIQKKERLEMNVALGKHLQFLTQMASANSIVRRMYAEYTRHFINLDYLLRQFSKEKGGQV